MTSKALISAVGSLVCCVVLFAGGSTSAARQAAGHPSDVVYLDVAVRDASGQPVHGLAADAFDVLDGGQPANIVGFSSFDLPPAPRAANVAATARAMAHNPIWVRGVPYDVVRNDELVDRLVAIVIDDTRLDEAGAAETWTAVSGLDIARGIVNRLGPDDRAAVFFTFMGRQQGFTSDRAKLLAAIDSYAPRSTNASACGGEGSPDGCAVAALQRVADTLPTEMSAPSTRAVVAFITGALGVPATNVSNDAPQTGDALRLFRALQSAKASVYTFGPAGAGGDAGRFARATGGRAIVDTIPPDAQVAAVLDEISSYYRFVIRPATTGSFQPVTVRVARPGVEVRTRSGYVVPGGVEDAPPMPATPLERALVSNVPATGLLVGSSVAVFGVPGRREAIASVVTSVTSHASDGAGDWHAEVAATAFDRDWRPRASHRQTIEVTRRAGSGPVSVDVISAMELLPGRYEVRVAGDSGGRAGSVFVDVDVPEFGNLPLSASGAVVSIAPAPYAAVPLLADTIPVTPTSRRVFVRGEAPEVFLRFYQGGRGRLRNVPVSLTITNAAGEGIVQGTETILPSQFTEARSTDWRLALPIERLAPGEYLLTVEATLDDRSVARQVRFGVVQ